jgi:AraC-like DNA-binding protein
MQKLILQKINPVIRGANYSTINPLRFGPRINYGYQLFYVFNGTGTGCVNKNNFDLAPGVIAIYGPGDVHEFRSHDHEAMTFATIYFSWQEVDAKRMATTNQNVAKLSDDYWRLADPKVFIGELPPIPFVLRLPPEKRITIEVLLRKIGNSFKRNNNPLLQLKYKSALLELIYELIKFNRNSSGHVQHYIIRKFKEYIDNHYRDELNRGKVSHFLGVSESYLTALLRKKLNTNFTDYLTAIRMQQAIELLQYSNLSVKEIAATVGFQNYNYFVARFRQLHTKSPGAFR